MVHVFGATLSLAVHGVDPRILPPVNVTEQYEARLAAVDQQARARDAADARIAFIRLAVVAATIVLAWMVFARELFPAAILLVPFAAFVVLVIVHERGRRRRERLERVVAFYRRRLALLQGDWSDDGNNGERFRSEAHPYADDLDLFGHASVFHLLSVAQTPAGEETLAAWLTSPAAAEVVRERQGAVAELRDDLEVRERLAAVTSDIAKKPVTESLLEWAEGPEIRFTAIERLATSFVAIAASVTFVYWLVRGDAIPFLVALAAHTAVLARLRGRVHALTAPVGGHHRELTTLVEVMEAFETRSFSAPLLRRRWNQEAPNGSRELSRLVRLIDLLDAMRNQFFILFGYMWLWNEHVAFAIQRWRERNGRLIRGWRGAVGELEALLSFATHAYEHPTDTFPVIAEGEMTLHAAAVAHPLLPEARAVRNDVRLGGAERIWIISGSNMSGKSTLLRAVGTNVVLALAGGTVRAAEFRVSPFTVGASIRINDSLQQGSSRFYAELLRIKQIVSLAATSPPLLFFLDEIFGGTNSHDRGVGAEGVVRALLKERAVGFVTTHDLAVTQLAGHHSESVRNVHFEDQIEAGRMVFDYKLRDGVVMKSNALELMRSVGLDV